MTRTKEPSLSFRGKIKVDVAMMIDLSKEESDNDDDDMVQLG